PPRLVQQAPPLVIPHRLDGDARLPGQRSNGEPVHPCERSLTPYLTTALTVGVMPVIELTDATFDEVVHAAPAGTPVLVEFGAEWCGPCKMMEPVLCELADDPQSNVLVATIDIDDNLAIARRFEIMSAPTLTMFVDGQAERRLFGAPAQVGCADRQSRLGSAERTSSRHSGGHPWPRMGA